MSVLLLLKPTDDPVNECNGDITTTDFNFRLADQLETVSPLRGMEQLKRCAEPSV